MKKVKEITFEQKCIFNDYCMRELGLNLDDNDRLVDDDTQSILQYREKFIKYQEDECVPIRPDEVEMDLLRNPRLMGILFGIYLQKFSERKPEADSAGKTLPPEHGQEFGTEFSGISRSAK